MTDTFRQHFVDCMGQRLERITPTLQKCSGLSMECVTTTLTGGHAFRNVSRARLGTITRASLSGRRRGSSAGCEALEKGRPRLFRNIGKCSGTGQRVYTHRGEE
ncbi:hypothetical protein NDU88_001818 [Pleurodeles waltl]|uniref:Uncharacterized protein n=1 Tax=Pleurodeles waltl TaxID=8319 RepID=A0AAV7RBF9_PLEWA|nr:hypothetical protein NDU88_001818 [Pleurodeles waltl]